MPVKTRANARRRSRAKRRAVRASDLPAMKPLPVDYKMLLEWAKKNPPPQSWFDETDFPFVVEHPVKRTRR
jgi:hypothetical protein